MVGSEVTSQKEEKRDKPVRVEGGLGVAAVEGGKSIEVKKWKENRERARIGGPTGNATAEQRRSPGKLSASHQSYLHYHALPSRRWYAQKSALTAAMVNKQWFSPPWIYNYTGLHRIVIHMCKMCSTSKFCMAHLDVCKTAYTFPTMNYGVV